MRVGQGQCDFQCPFEPLFALCTDCLAGDPEVRRTVSLGLKFNKMHPHKHVPFRVQLEGRRSDLRAGDPSDPVIVMVLCQLVDLLQGERGAHAPEVASDVEALGGLPHAVILALEQVPHRLR